jgi:plastocyanin
VNARRPGVLGLLAAAALLRGAVLVAAPVSGGASHTVTIENMVYAPARLVVHRGDRIVWVNKDLFPHTVTAAAFNSGSIGVGGRWSYTVQKSGDFAYACTFHPTMKGELKVE